MTARPRVVAHVLNGLSFGGNENLCLQLIKHGPPGVRHVLFNIQPSRTEMEPAFRACADLHIVDVAYARHRRGRFLVEMAWQLRRVRAEAVLVQPFGVHVFVALAARAAGIERILTHAGNPPPLEAKRRRLWKRIVYASRVLRVPIMACSGMVDRELRLLAGHLPTGSQPLWNGVDVEFVEAIAARERANRAPNSPPVVGMVARLNSMKDHDTLVRAFTQIRRVLPDAELWLVGDGERRESIAALAKELGVAGALRFWGARLDVFALLGKMDVFVFSTTRDEGFGIALGEAMAARVPVVASDVGACREVTADGQAGWLVPPEDPQKLAEAVLGLLTDHEKARALSERAYLHTKTQLDIRVCAQRYYEPLLNDR